MPGEQKDQPDVPEMTVGALKSHVDTRFAAIDDRFDAIDRRFDAVDKRFAAIDERFNAIDERFAAIDKRFVAFEERLVEESAATRRHFDVAAERLEARLDLFAEAYQANHDRIDDHERRIRKLEDRRR